MMQEPLFHESIDDALRAAVSALGGFKKVGAAMRPELPADRAGNWLRDCLTDGRREVLDPPQVMWILRAARQAGYHGVMQYLSRECGYCDPMPLEPEDERAQLQRQFVEATRLQAQLLDRMERLAGAPVRSFEARRA